MPSETREFLATLTQLHGLRKGLAKLVREWEDRLPAPFVGELNALVLEQIHESRDAEEEP